MVKPNGSKLWQQHCRFANGEKTLSHGAYPDVGIAEVRRNRVKAKELLDGGIDLSTQNKLDRIERERNARTTLRPVAEDYLDISYERELAEATIYDRSLSRRLVATGLRGRAAVLDGFGSFCGHL